MERKTYKDKLRSSTYVHFFGPVRDKENVEEYLSNENLIQRSMEIILSDASVRIRAGFDRPVSIEMF